MRKIKFLSVFVLLALLLSAWPGVALAQGPRPPIVDGEEGVVVIVSAEKDPSQPPADWVLVRDESHTYYDDRKQPVEIRVREYRGPLTPLSKEGQCEQRDEGETKGLRTSDCSYWYPGSCHATAKVGDVTQHLYTSFTRYHYYGPGDGSAWYLDYSKVWWTRDSTAWSTGQTRMWIANTNGAKDCEGDEQEYGDYNLWFTPGWCFSDQTCVFYFHTSDYGVLMSADWLPRIHQIGPTPVKYNGSSYGTLPEIRHRFWQHGYGG